MAHPRAHKRERNAFAASLVLAGLVLSATATAQAPSGGVQPPATEQLRQAIEEIKKRIARPPETSTGLASSLARELESAHARVAELAATLERVRGERDRLKEERDRLEAELANARAEGQRLETLLAERDERLRALDGRLATLAESARSEQARLEQALAEAHARAETAEQTASEQAQQIAALEGEQQRLREILAERERALAELSARSEKIARERDGLRGELSALVERLGELEGELKRERTQAESRLSALQQENEELRQLAALSVEELQSLGETLVRTLAEQQALIQSLQQISAGREAAERELAAARREVELYAAEAAQLRARLGALEQPAAGNAPLAKLEASPEPSPRPARPLPEAIRLQLAQLRASETPDGAILTVVEGNAFEFGSERFTEAANATLARVARLIELAEPKRIRIVGHTDAQGDEEANRRLSLRRAQAVRDWLVRNRGLDPAKTTVEGRGKDQPIASNDTPEGRRANRRVEVFLER